MKRHFCLFILAFAVLGFSACKTHPHKHKTAVLLDDKVTSDRVQLALLQDKSGQFQNVKVTTLDGVVTLRGTVPNSDQKRKAEQIAQQIHRTKEVKNELQIIGSDLK